MYKQNVLNYYYGIVYVGNSIKFFFAEKIKNKGSKLLKLFFRSLIFLSKLKLEGDKVWHKNKKNPHVKKLSS